MIRKIPELLAPAGGASQLNAAIENGADAVYLGGHMFNARINAGNFSEEELKLAIQKAHLHGVKVYIAMNILISDSDMVAALEYAKKVYEMGADAVIVQDIGLAVTIRKALPDLRIHLSTQGTVYNVSGVGKALKIGFDRVVLAREVSLKDIEEICGKTEGEIEIFVHGAMCICYSGQCHLSRNIGGRSGNKGVCAQPCRLAYDGAHILSPKDMCAVDLLGEISEAGVKSIKIEGRMKSAEYVAIVTRIYRKYLDEYREKGEYQVSEEDRLKLLQIFNRGDFTQGYLVENPKEQLMSGNMLPKHQGIYIGKVIDRVSDTLVDVELKSESKNMEAADENRGRKFSIKEKFMKKEDENVGLHNINLLNMGDGVEIHSPDMAGNVISYLKEVGQNVLRIGDIRGDVRKGDKVYKLTDKKLMQEARSGYGGGGKSARKVDIALEVSLKSGELPYLKIVKGDIAVEVRGETPLVSADKKELSEEDVRKQLLKTGDSSFRVAECNVQLDRGVYMAVSMLNQLRREGIALLEQKMLEPRELSGESLEKYEEIKERLRAENIERFVKEVGGKKAKEDGAGAEQGKEGVLQIYIHKLKGDTASYLEKIIKYLEYGEVEVMVPLEQWMKQGKEYLGEFEACSNPYIPTITKGWYDEYIRGNFEQIVKACRGRKLYIGNLGWIDEFKEAGLELGADSGLNIYNQEAVKWAEEEGFKEIKYSHEIGEGYFGAVPLMYSEHIYDVGDFSDRKGQKYNIINLEKEEKSILITEADPTEAKTQAEFRQINKRLRRGSARFYV